MGAVAPVAQRDFAEQAVRDVAADATGVVVALYAAPLPALTIETLGGFRVRRGRQAVTVSDWQSKKARDLLKLLIARRGRPLPRDAAMEALWPDGDPRRLSNRLSVALSTLRTVLDPARRFTTQHFVVAETGALRLDLDHVDVDVERFFTDAHEGLRLRRTGQHDTAGELLRSASRHYVGDFLEEDAYEDWATDLREELRMTFGLVATALADDALERGDHDAATHSLLRVLELDRYDEHANLTLVRALAAAGRHGHARRAYATYAVRMHELGLKPSPLPHQPR